MKNKVIVLTGVTGSGKTKLSVKIAKKFNCEIINVDATQFYKNFNIGTDKITKTEMEGIKHHMISFLDADEDYNISKFKQAAERHIKDIIKRNKTPLLVGSSGLYIACLIFDYDFTQERNKDFEMLYEFTSDEDLFNMLKKIDPDEANKINSLKARRKVLRALEIYYVKGITKTEFIKQQKQNPPFDYLLIQLDIDKEKLLSIIKKRIDIEFNKGFISEVEGLIKHFPNLEIYNSFNIMGYSDVFLHVKNKISLQEAKANILQRTKMLVKRQRTFYANKFLQKRVIDNYSNANAKNEAFKYIDNFLHNNE